MFTKRLVKDRAENVGNIKIAEVLNHLNLIAERYKQPELQEIIYYVYGIVKEGNGIDTDTLQKAALLDSYTNNLYLTRTLIQMGAGFNKETIEHVRNYNKEAAALMEGVLVGLQRETSSNMRARL